MSDQEPSGRIFCWNELMSRDTGAAEKFYTELLGWKAIDSGVPGLEYTVFKLGDKNIGGLMAMPPDIPKQVPAHWMAYICVEDVDAMAEKTVKLGGTVMHAPEDVPNVGRFCVIQDPTGAVVSLMTFIPMSGQE